MVQGNLFFKSSEQKTRPLTPTDLEREAASGDRRHDDEGVLPDLSGRCRKTPHRMHVFQRTHALRTRGGTNFFFSPQNTHTLVQDIF